MNNGEDIVYTNWKEETNPVMGSRILIEYDAEKLDRQWIPA